MRKMIEMQAGTKVLGFRIFVGEKLIVQIHLHGDKNFVETTPSTRIFDRST
jgi:hypothetical protein